MGTLGLGDLLGLFQCEDDGGLEHITSVRWPQAMFIAFAVARSWW